jgi:hypothetical protein
MARLGHASARAAMVYQHATEDRDLLIAERLTAMTEATGLAPVIPLAQPDGLARTGTDLARGPLSDPAWTGHTLAGQVFSGGRDRRRSGDLALFRCPPAVCSVVLSIEPCASVQLSGIG